MLNAPAHRGYASVLKHDEALLVAKNSAEFIHGCIRLTRDEPTQIRLAETGRSIVRRQFTRDAFYRAVEHSLAVVPKKPVSRKPRHLVL